PGLTRPPACLRPCAQTVELLIDLVRLLEPANRALAVHRTFHQGFSIPFAAVRAEKIAAIDVNGAGQSRNRICHGMNDVVAKRLRVADAQRSCACSLDTPVAVGHTAPAHMTLAARRTADHPPH